jgi:hypothetical protein
MPLFLFIFHIFPMYIHSFNHIHTTHLSVAIRRGLSPSLHRFEAQWESLPVVPSRESNSESDLPYSKPTLYQLSNAAPKTLLNCKPETYKILNIDNTLEKNIISKL